MTGVPGTRPDGQAGGERVFEIQTERDEAIRLFEGDYVGPILRVRYRVDGVRRWTRFLMVPHDGQTIDDLEALAAEAAGGHYRQLVNAGAA